MGILPAVVTALAVSVAAAQKVDLGKERLGGAPAAFEPIVGTWMMTQDGPDKVVMVDGGRGWRARTPDAAARAERPAALRHFERRADGQREAVRLLPIALVRSVPDFSKGTIGVKFKTIAGDAAGRPAFSSMSSRMGTGSPSATTTPRTTWRSSSSTPASAGR
jgi:hypothetical protein